MTLVFGAGKGHEQFLETLDQDGKSGESFYDVHVSCAVAAAEAADNVFVFQ
jgi:hypothetical protein